MRGKKSKQNKTKQNQGSRFPQPKWRRGWMLMQLLIWWDVAFISTSESYCLLGILFPAAELFLFTISVIHIFLCIIALSTCICVEFLSWAFWSVHTWTPLWAVTVSNSWASTGICSHSLACQHRETAWNKNHSLLAPPPGGCLWFEAAWLWHRTSMSWSISRKAKLRGRQKGFWKKGRKEETLN